MQTTREERATAFLRALATEQTRHASALSLGIAATRSERRAKWLPMKIKSAIGLAIGVELVRRGIATVTKGNRFELLRVSSCAVCGHPGASVARWTPARPCR
jgi:hypothetical protein